MEFLVILQDSDADGKIIHRFTARNPSLSPVSKHVLPFSYSVLGTVLKDLYTTIKGIFLLFCSIPLRIRNESSQTPELSSNLTKHHPSIRLGISLVRFICEDELTI